MLIVLCAPAGVRSDQAGGVASDIVDRLQRSPWVMNVASPWIMPPDRPPQAAAQLVSKDEKSGLIVAGLKGGENKAQEYVGTLMGGLVHDATASPCAAVAWPSRMPRSIGRTSATCC